MALRFSTPVYGGPNESIFYFYLHDSRIINKDWEDFLPASGRQSLGDSLRSCRYANGNNCTAKCSTPEGAFADYATFLTCMAFPTVATLVSSNKLVYWTVDSLQKIGINNNSIDSAEKVYDVISRCSSQFLEKSEAHFGQYKTENWLQWLPLKYVFEKTVDHNGVAVTREYEYANICRADRPTVNADIAGIGAYITFFIQAGISLGVFFLMKIFTSWGVCILYIMRRYVKRMDKSVLESPGIIEGRLRRHLGPLITAAVDFHKIQCFFQLAVQAASLVILSRNSSSLGAFTQQQLSNNLKFLLILSFGGLIPIAFTLGCLHLFGKSSTYLVALSFITISVSTVTFAKASNSEVGIGSLNNGLPFDPVPECGSINPIRMCPNWFGKELGDTGFELSKTQGQKGLVLPWLLLFSILLENFLKRWSSLGHWRKKPPPHQISESVEDIQNPHDINHSVYYLEGIPSLYSSSHLQRRIWNRLLIFTLFTPLLFSKAKRPKNIGEWTYLVVQFWYMILLVYFLMFFYIYLKHMLDLKFRGGLNPADWGFGQVVAVSVFIPSMIEYAYLEIRGVKQGAQYRLLNRFTVTDLELDDLATNRQPDREQQVSRHYQSFTSHRRGNKSFAVNTSWVITALVCLTVLAYAIVILFIVRLVQVYYLRNRSSLTSVFP